MNVIGIDAAQPRGVTFPAKAVKKVINSVFPVREYYWNDIENRLNPLVNKVIETAAVPAV